MSAKNHMILVSQGFIAMNAWTQINYSLGELSQVAKGTRFKREIDRAIDAVHLALKEMIGSLESVALAIQRGTEFSPERRAAECVGATTLVYETLRALASAIREDYPKISRDISRNAAALGKALRELKKIAHFH